MVNSGRSFGQNLQCAQLLSAKYKHQILTCNMFTQRHDYSSGNSCHGDGLCLHKSKLPTSRSVNFNAFKIVRTATTHSTCHLVLFKSCCEMTMLRHVEIVVMFMPLIFGQSLLILCGYFTYIFELCEHLKLCFVVIL